MKILTILNLKGGVGKTTTAINLAEYIANIESKRVLLIDADSQANLTQFYGAEVPKQDNFFSIFANRDAVKPVILKKGLHLIPSNARTAKVNSLIEGEKDSLYILKDTLKHRNYSDIFDYCIIDCPPSVGLTVVNAIVAAHHIIIPLTAGEFAFQGLEAILETISSVQHNFNNEVTILGILPTMYHLGRRASQQLDEQLKNLQIPVFNTPIRFCEGFRRAELAHQSVYAYDPKSNAAIDMCCFSQEVIHRIKQNNHVG